MHTILVKNIKRLSVGGLPRGTYYQYADVYKPNDNLWLRTQDGAVCLETGRHELFDQLARSNVCIIEKDAVIEIQIEEKTNERHSKS